MSTSFRAKIENWLQSSNPSQRKALLIAFLFGFCVRMIPELLSYPHPIGFDTIYYGWRLKEGVVWAHWSSIFSSWLFYGLTVPLYNLIGGDPFIMLKLIMPLLFGLNTCGIFYLATRGLQWSLRKGLFAVGLFSFQVAALGISWHFYRNMLGLGILLFAIPLILKENVDVRSAIIFGVLSLLVVFSHEYSSVLLLVALLGIIVTNAMSRRRQEIKKIILFSLPAVSVFFASILMKASPLYKDGQSNVLMAYQTSGHYSGPLFFLTNYLVVFDTVQSYSGYLDLLVSVVSMAAVLYIPILLLAVIGFFRNRVLDIWMIMLCVGAFSCLLVPFFSLDYWNRWLLMLVFPMTLYATNGIARALHSTRSAIASLWRFGSIKVSEKAAKGLILISLTSGFVFMTSPMFFGKSGVFSLPTTVNYLPSTMLSNSVPLNDVNDILRAFQWLDSAMSMNSCLLTHDALFYWAMYSLNNEHTLVFFKNDVSKAVSVALTNGFRCFWLVWWNINISWYGFRVPQDFLQIYDAGRVSVFEYCC